MDKRAQGLPINTIILALLGLVVLVILFYVLTNRLTIFTGAASECPGVCVVSSSPSGVADVPGVLETRGPAYAFSLDEQTPTGTECVASYEQRIFGSFISRGVRDRDNKPVVCARCCQRLA